MPQQTPEEELVSKVKKLLDTKFNGSVDDAFTYYAQANTSTGDRAISKLCLMAILKDSDIGNFLTRSIWATKIMEAVDTNKDDLISKDELKAILND